MPKALKSCPKSNKSPNLATLIVNQSLTLLSLLKVYANEEVSSKGRLYHKMCAKCKGCSRQLDFNTLYDGKDKVRTVPKGSFRLAACGCESAADCGKDIYFWRQTVAFLQGDRKFPISALTQPTANACGKSSNVNEPKG